MSVDFNTREMGCPFDIQLHYLQPLTAQQRGARSAASTRGANPCWTGCPRWCSTSMRGNSQAAFGDRAKLTVPCGKLQLNPKEKS